MPKKRNASGDGMIRKRKDGRWECRIMDGYTKDGRRNVVTFYGKTQAEVKQKRNEYNADKEGGLDKKQQYTLGEFADIWFERHKKNIAVATQEHYKYILRTIKEHLGKRMLNDIEAFEVEDFLDTLEKEGKSDSYISGCRGMLTQIYKRAEAYRFGYYEYIQVNLAYSSSRMASNRLTREQVQEMYRTHRIGTAFEPMKIDDIVEINNHFVCVKNMVNYIMEPLSFELIRKVHYDLTYGTFADRQHKLGTGEFRVSAVKDYGANPNNIQSELETMIRHYEKSPADLSRILNLYVTFEKIRPFDDYNGRVGRVLMLKECLRHGITPFIIDDKHRSDHIRGIEKWSSNPKLLLSLCTRAQERFEVQSRFCKSMQYNRPPEAMC